MLCAALVTDPEVLFLDEPTSGLDVQSARLIRRTVSDLNRRALTVFLTTHNMSEAGEICARVAINDKGCMVAMALWFTASAVGPLVPPWERSAKTCERLISTPVSLHAILAGDVISGFVFGTCLSKVYHFL